MDRTDKSLLAAIITGDKKAFEELIRRHGPAVMGYLVSATNDHCHSEDLFQETFKRVFEKAHTVKTENVKSWIFSIASRLMIDGYRKKKLKCISLNQCSGDNGCDMTSNASVLDDPSEGLIREEQKKKIRHAILSLPTKQRITLILAYYQQLSYQQVAEVLGCSTGTVKTQMFRALKTMSLLLSDITEGVS